MRDELCAACEQARFLADETSLSVGVNKCETAVNDPFGLWPAGTYGSSGSLPKPRIPVRFGVGPRPRQMARPGRWDIGYGI